MDLAAALTRAATDLALCRGSSRDPALKHARRVRRGVYCTDPSRSPSFEESVIAALLVLPAGSVACGLTAARLCRLDALVPVQPDGPLSFLVPGRKGSIRLTGCEIRFDGFTTVDLPAGIPATSRPRTIIDVVADLDMTDAVPLVEAALRAEPLLTDELIAERSRRLPRRGRDHVGFILHFASSLSESVLDSRARVLFHLAGLPAPVQQARIRLAGRPSARVDFLWPAARLIVEVDGLAKYDEPGAWQDEKARQNALIAAGYTVLRFTWADVMHRPDSVVRQITSALLRAAL